MTRETKIGLLVGLAFIIVIGILLSDHLTSSTEPPSATMSQAGSIVRSAVNTPAGTQQPMQEVSAPVVQTNQPVRAAQDFQPRPQPVKIVEVNTPPQNEPVTITSPNTNPVSQEVAHKETVSKPDASAPDRVAQNVPTYQPVVIPQTRSTDPVIARLNAEAQKVGEAIVPVFGSAAQPPAVALSKYRAESGDSLSKIAAKVYGNNSKATMAAIVEANPSLRENPNLVIEGRTYNVPQLTNKPGASAPDFSTPVATVQAKPQLAQQQSMSEAGASYVVEEGDNLTRIAQDQCGTAEALAAIKELNRDLLKGGDVIRPGMKLRLPAKSVAVNN